MSCRKQVGTRARREEIAVRGRSAVPVAATMLRLFSRSLRQLPLPSAAASALPGLPRAPHLGSRAASSSTAPALAAASVASLHQAAPPSPLLAIAIAHSLSLQPPGLGAIVRRAAGAVLPSITAAFTILPDLLPAMVLTGKKKHHGKNKRYPKKANHGALPCSHVMRKQRWAAQGKVKYNPKR